MQKILITGGTGFIGSHTVVQLESIGYECVILDSLANSRPAVVDRITKITGKTPVLVEGDVRDRACLDAVFAAHDIDSVIHFAGLKAVAESIREPLRYYDCNVSGTITLLSAMAKANVKTIVFSSSATVYGEPDFSPIPESAPFRPASPYGKSKAMVESILTDLTVSDPAWRVALLRYFNPVGAHPSGMMGEDPAGIPNNLMPFVCQVASGRHKTLNIFGNDYPTADGTAERDYIHVMDLAEGHLAALHYLVRSDAPRLTIANLGTSRGHSVLDVVTTFARVNNTPIPYQFVARRPGDVPAYWADATRAEQTLGWKATRSLEDMCRDSWNWQTQNPTGYIG
ncbi:MAG: UDP-glucose 4-epimerase GalE [Rhodocyclaceae bacterium]|nr:UDP-glucose 4-epimerase GalE [Rhodocyclaceae bacterium]